MNGLPLKTASVVEDEIELDEYLDTILMKMDEDARGFLLNVVPIVLRINIFIVNIDTNERARKGLV